MARPAAAVTNDDDNDDGDDAFQQVYVMITVFILQLNQIDS